MAGPAAVSWDKTHRAGERLASEGRLTSINGIEYYQGRPLIHRDSPIDGGVYLGAGQREAIVVDSTRSDSKIRELYQKVLARAREYDPVEKKYTLNKGKVLNAVFDTVKEAMPVQDDAAVQRIVDRRAVGKDGKIDLDVFIKEGVGECRHDALACAVLLELLKKDGFVSGRASVDRNAAFYPEGDDRLSGGHAWCRYTNSVGEVYVLDVAQGFIGSLEEASKNPKAWAYQRPDDY